MSASVSAAVCLGKPTAPCQYHQGLRPPVAHAAAPRHQRTDLGSEANVLALARAYNWHVYELVGSSCLARVAAQMASHMQCCCANHVPVNKTFLWTNA